MAAPEISSGTIEQALYTWSKKHLGGIRGQGFTAVSEGLREAIDWLAALDLSGIVDFESGVAESEGFPAWKEMASVGVTGAGPVRIVYRKISSAGEDAVGRNRSAIHMLLGRSEDLDFASIAHDDSHWLPAEACPLDQPPRLEALRMGDLSPRQAQHDCGVVDRLAFELLQDLTLPPYRLEVECTENTCGPDEFVTRLLTAVPTQMWNAIELDWRVGREGPVARVAMVEPAQGPPSLGRAKGAGRSECELHRDVDQFLSRLPGSQQVAWSAFAIAAPDVFRRASTPPAPASAREPVLGGSVRSRLDAAVGTAIGTPAWDGKKQLEEVEAVRALQAIAALSERRWLREFSPDECQALLGGIQAGKLRRAIDLLDATHIPIEDLASAWQETGLAVVGGALLGRMRGKAPERWRAVPSHIEQHELKKLVGHLAKDEKGLDQLMILLRHGFLQEGRKLMVDAIVAVDSRPSFLFETVLEHAEVDAHLLIPVLREELDRLANWKGIGPGLRGALELGLREHKSAFERFLSQLWRGDASIDGGASASSEQRSS